jgi:hypothetical protein
MTFDENMVERYKAELKACYGEVYDLLEPESIMNGSMVEIDKIKLDGKIASLLSTIAHIKKMK